MPGLEGAHPPARLATRQPSRTHRERGEWRDQRYQHQGSRSCVGRHAATTPAARELGIAAVAVIVGAAFIAARIGPIVAKIVQVALEVIRIAALTTVLVLALAAITWAAIMITRWQLRRT